MDSISCTKSGMVHIEAKKKISLDVFLHLEQNQAMNAEDIIANKKLQVPSTSTTCL